jgi:hypothetical protein
MIEYLHECAVTWQVDNPSSAPVVLEGHRGEVTAVDWYSLLTPATTFVRYSSCSVLQLIDIFSFA